MPTVQFVLEKNDLNIAEIVFDDQSRPVNVLNAQTMAELEPADALLKAREQIRVLRPDLV